jgi:hypothetical protein
MFKWFPEMAAKFDAEFINTPSINIQLMEAFDVVIDNKITGKVKIMDLDFTGDPICELIAYVLFGETAQSL